MPVVPINEITRKKIDDVNGLLYGPAEVDYKNLRDTFIDSTPDGSNFTDSQVESIYKSSIVPKISQMFKRYRAKNPAGGTDQSKAAADQVYKNGWLSVDPREGLKDFIEQFEKWPFQSPTGQSDSRDPDGNPSRPFTNADDAKIKKYFVEIAERQANSKNPAVGFIDSLFKTGDFRTAADIEQKAKENNLTALEQAAGGVAFTKGQPEPLKEADRTTKSQCSLLSMLFDEDAHPYNQYVSDVMSATPLGEPAFKDRIIPVKTKKPDTFLNRCFQDENVRDFFDFIQTPARQNNLIKRLFFVNKNENGELVEINLPLTTAQLGENAATQYSALILERQSLINQNASQDAIQRVNNQIERFITNRTVQAAHTVYSLDNISIKYEGTNPSTARNDVQVSIKFILESFQAMDEVLGTYNGPNGAVNIKLKDLVTLPVSGPEDGGPGFMLKNQYSPNYGRLRLKVKPGSIPGKKKRTGLLPGAATGTPTTRETKVNYDFEDSGLIIDLTTIDHKISRKADDGEITFEINYRGYFESVMNMPFNDALATNAIINRRKQRSDIINRTIAQKNCNSTTIREMLRIERAAFEAESKTVKYSSIQQRLVTARKIYECKINPEQYAASGYDISKGNIVKNVRKSNDVGWIENNKAQTIAEKGTDEPENLAEAYYYGPLSGTILTFDMWMGEINFFYLGDLLEVLTDCLYEDKLVDGRAVHRENVKHLNMKFLLAPISLPNPQKPGEPLIINPANIPISLTFFASWFHDSIVKKELTYYAIGTFIRDLLERLINDTLYEVCFSHLLPNESPPILRVGYFESTTEDHQFRLQPKSAGLVQSIESFYTDMDLQVAPYFKRNIPFVEQGSTAPVPLKTVSYCMIYMQSPPYYRELKKNKKTLKDDKFVPTITSGLYHNKISAISNVSFSKTDSPYLREARYFNNSYGALSLLSSVYDLSLTFIGKHGNFYLFPGQVINFVLMDFEPTSIYTRINGADEYVWSTSNNNDPHTAKTPANVLGFGGYYIIKSVTYDLPLAEAAWKITVSLKFLGTDADQDVREAQDVITSIAEDDVECINLYNEMVDRFYEIPDTKREKGTFTNVGAGPVSNASAAQPSAGAATNASAPPQPAPTAQSAQTPTQVPQVTSGTAAPGSGTSGNQANNTTAAASNLALTEFEKSNFGEGLINNEVDLGLAINRHLDKFKEAASFRSSSVVFSEGNESATIGTLVTRKYDENQEGYDEIQITSVTVGRFGIFDANKLNKFIVVKTDSNGNPTIEVRTRN